LSEVIDVAKKDGRWTECPSCHEIIITTKLDELLWVCPHCDHHFRLTAGRRIEMLCDDYKPLVTNTARVGRPADSAIVGGRAVIDGQDCVLAVMDFTVKGGSMGQLMAADLVKLMRRAAADEQPFVVFTASGGVRVQEGIMGLMQMLRTSYVRGSIDSRPMITVFTDPTLGGVSASFASLADLMLAEPGARIGFAGPRVIKSTTNCELDPDFQDASRLLRDGFLDGIVHRHELKSRLGYLLRWF